MYLSYIPISAVSWSNVCRDHSVLEFRSREGLFVPNLGSESLHLSNDDKSELTRVKYSYR